MKKFAVISASALCLATGAIAEEYPYSLPFNAANEFSQIGVTWAETVAEVTGGEVQFEADFNAGLVSIPEALDAVGSGVVPAAMTVVSAMSGVVPAFAFIEMGGRHADGHGADRRRDDGDLSGHREVARRA